MPNCRGFKQNASGGGGEDFQDFLKWGEGYWGILFLFPGYSLVIIK